jgi:hypothetical protein
MPGKRQEAAYVEPSLAYLCQRASYLKATGVGKGVTELEPRKRAAQEIREVWALLNSLDPLVTEKEKVAP